mmetsp:Transcript_32588/g.91700  ORF Transcript_32588/g.91700 Transcript_32588/m.91700 type:complete len:540 (+) Transcript_32588:50-1669(+)
MVEASGMRRQRHVSRRLPLLALAPMALAALLLAWLPTARRASPPAAEEASAAAFLAAAAPRAAASEGHLCASRTALGPLSCRSGRLEGIRPAGRRHTASRGTLPRLAADKTSGTSPARDGVARRAQEAFHDARNKDSATSREASAQVLERTPNQETWLELVNERLDSGLGSAILLLSAAGSMALANRPGTAAAWLGLWSANLGPAIGGHHLSVRSWINEGLMSLFFFYVGLEIKKEIVEGSLSSPRKALLPCIAALGGMVVPMSVYAVTNMLMVGGSFEGITIPMATDIAFAMGIFGFFRRRMPAAAEPFLLTLATVDDLGAIAVIAICFAGALSPAYLLGAVLALAAAFLYGRRGISGSSLGFIVPGLTVWYCLLRGGLCADIAGFLTALCVPLRSRDGGAEVIHRVAKRWAPACGMLILPLFALANCAVPLTGSLEAGSMAVPAGVGLGLLVGKPLGIVGASLLAVKAGWASMPPGVTKRHLWIIGILGSLGFTMCLFLIENSLTGRTAEMTKVSMLLASVAAAILSSCLMRAQPRR